MKGAISEKTAAPAHIVALLKICPEELCLPINELCQVMPKMIRMSEASIRKKVKPNDVLDRLRLAFWDEVNRSILKGRRVRLRKVLRGCCTRQKFLDIYLSDRRCLLWLITPPKNYALSMRQIVARWTAQMLDILSQPVAVHLAAPNGVEALNLLLRIVEIGIFVETDKGSRPSA
jgi:hypothetical protein